MYLHKLLIYTTFYAITAAQSFPLSKNKLPALMRPSRLNLQAVHLRILSPEVRQKCRKQVIPFRYRRMDEDCELRRHISPCPVRSVRELQPVESRLKGGLLTGKQGEQARQYLEDVDRLVRLPPKQPICAVRRKDRHPSASRVYVVWAYGPLAWRHLPIK